MTLKETLKSNTGFNEDHATARYTRKFRFSARVAFALLLITFAFLGVLIYWLVYPYDRDIISEPSDFLVEEFTSDGIPVIRKGEPLRYTTDICSAGVSSTVSREALIYGQWQDLNGDTRADSNAGVIASFSLSEIQLFIDSDICVEDFLVQIELPNDLPTGNFYSIKNVSTFQPNPVRTISSINQTQIFLYLKQGESIP